MLRGLFLTALVAMACAAGGCATSYHGDMIASARELDARFTDAFNHHDVDAVMANYWKSPRLVVYPPGKMEAHGWDEVKKAFTEVFTSMPGAKLELTETNYMTEGHVVIGWGLWKLTTPVPGIAPVVLLGRYTEVSANKDGQWVFIHDHPSAPLPAPPSTILQRSTGSSPLSMTNDHPKLLPAASQPASAPAPADPPLYLGE